MDKAPSKSEGDGSTSFVDMVRIFLTAWPIVLVCVILALVAAGWYLHKVPRQYEASATIELAHQIPVSRVSKEWIEPVGPVVNWIRTEEFKQSVIEVLGWKKEERKDLFWDTFRVNENNTNYIEVRSRGFSQEDAKKAIEVISSLILASNNGVMKREMEQRKEKIASLIHDIAYVEAFLRRVDPLLDGVSLTERPEAIEWLHASIVEKFRLSSLQDQKTKLEAELNPEHAIPAQVLGQIRVSDRPVHPRARRIWVAAVVGGLLLGLLLASLREIIRLDKNNSVSECSHPNG